MRGNRAKRCKVYWCRWLIRYAVSTATEGVALIVTPSACFPLMRKIAILALALTCVSAPPAFSQTTPAPGPAPNAVTPGGTTPTQTAPSIAGGVPNPVTPLGVDPRTQLPANSGQATLPTTQNLPLETPEPHLTPLGTATIQNNPIGRPGTALTPSNSLPTTTQRSPNEAGCGFACGPPME